MKFAQIFAAIAIVMMISGTALAGKGENNSIQSHAGVQQGGGNDWGKEVSKNAKSAPSAIPNVHGKGKP